MSDNTFLVVGLGNPGPGYAFNRHNVGQMVLDVLADRIGAKFKSHKAGAVVAEGRLGGLGGGIGGTKVILAKSTGYMNTSGRPVSGLLKFYGVPLENLIVIHDELDIPAAEVRIKVAGGHAGHNGLRDIIAACGGPEFIRVRVGIGRPPGQMETADYVLKDFGTVERKELPVTLEISADAVEAIVCDGVGPAQQKFHSA
jgi:PTH1 family peptidyl-tRNA hydrolase